MKHHDKQCADCMEHQNAGGICTGAEYPCDCWTDDDPWGGGGPDGHPATDLKRSRHMPRPEKHATQENRQHGQRKRLQGAPG